MNNDLISREALKEALTNTQTSLKYMGVFTVDDIKEFIDNAPTVEIPVARWDCYCEGQKVGYEKALSERTQGEWIITAEDNEGIHRIQCPFCRYEKGSDFIDYITVTFEKLPPFCESCGAELK